MRLDLGQDINVTPDAQHLHAQDTFAVGAAIPGIIGELMSAAQITLIVAVTTLVALLVLGGLGASAGGADMARGAFRVSFWGALAMAGHSSAYALRRGVG